MRIRNTILAFAGASLLGGILLTGCTSDNTTNPTPTDNRSKQISGSSDTRGTVTGLTPNQLYTFSVSGSAAATTIAGVSATDDKSITVFWTRGTGDNGPDTIFYQAVSTPVSTAGTITWATAYKTSSKNIYETSDPSPGHPSGLIVSGNTTQTAPLDTADKKNIDLVLLTDATVPGSNISLVSSNVAYTGGRTTFFGTNSYLVHGGADNLFFSGDITSFVPVSGGSTTNFYDIPSANVGDSSAVLLVNVLSHTTPGATNFARIEIVPDGTTHQLYTIAGSHKYITVNVWAQPTVGWGYVSRPTANKSTTLAPKGPAMNIIRE
ncbi:MAG TPA: hypothetical protein VEW28_08330 [Candidatus Kapabacteria bacterium]|nr:hypothetical protein [Candidatus Kapabacteria bacterium]